MTHPQHPMAERRVVTTVELRRLLDQGYRVHLPAVHLPDGVRERFDDTTLADAIFDDRQIVTVTPKRRDVVQCIAVADPASLYVTDDFIATHNTNNIYFIKSNDEQMLETLEKLGGRIHRSRSDSKTVHENKGKVMGGKVDQSVSYTYSTTDEALISMNEMLFLPMNNSILFAAGEFPVWNRNQTTMPMSWRMFGGNAEKTIVHPGHTYNLITIPTLSTALDFDVRTNQPDFLAMLDKRLTQAMQIDEATELYRTTFGLTAQEMQYRDPDTLAADIMNIAADRAHAIREARRAEREAAERANSETAGRTNQTAAMTADGTRPPAPAPQEDYTAFDAGDVSEDREVLDLAQQEQIRRADHERLRYAEGTVARDNLIDVRGQVRRNETFNHKLVLAAEQVKVDLGRDSEHFSWGPAGELCNGDGTAVYITAPASEQLQRARDQLNRAIDDPASTVHADSHLDQGDMTRIAGMQVTDAFLRWLASLDTWTDLAGGAWDRAVATQMRRDNDTDHTT